MIRTLRMLSVSMSMVLVTTALNTTTVWSNDLDVARSWGLLGRWAERCDKPPQFSNNQVTFEPRPGKDTLSMEVSYNYGSDQEKVISGQPNSMMVLPNGRLQFLSESGKMVVFAKDQIGRLRLMDAASTNRQFVVRDGSVTFRDKSFPGTRWLARCD